MRIISDSESRQILKNDLTRRAQRKYAAQLETADSEERQKIMSQIETEVEQELRDHGPGRGRKWRFLSGIISGEDGLLH